MARSLAGIIKGAKRRVAVTIFASNVARIKAVADAAKSAGRQLVVAGRAMHRMIEVAIATGYLPKNFKYHDQEHFSYLEPNEVVLLCTGSQGEPRAALARIAEDEHPDIELDKGDLVIFSSRTIPGNERVVGRIQNKLVDLGCELVTDGDALVHVTGHPRREELKEMYAWVRPRIAIPMHGEPRHLAEHAKLARAAGVARGARRSATATSCGWRRARPRSSTRRPSAGCSATGACWCRAEDGPVRERRSLAFAGIVVVALARSGRGELLAEPEVVLDGVPTADAEAGRCTTSCSMPSTAPSQHPAQPAQGRRDGARGGAPGRALGRRGCLGQAADRQGAAGAGAALSSGPHPVVPASA